MSLSAGSQDIKKQSDGTYAGYWRAHHLKTAFQPIMALREGRAEVVGYEALLRPFVDREARSPVDFFASVAAHEAGYVEMLARTLHLMNAGALLDPEVLVFINFDPRRFNRPEAADSTLNDMQMALEEAGIEPGRVVCEITEHVADSDSMLVELARALRASGYGVAVDDYGAAGSNMERIRALNPDIVKFEARWLADGDARCQRLVHEVGAFAQMGIRTVFEGVEEEWQLAFAHEAGVDMVQGFALARPQLAAPGMHGATSEKQQSGTSGAPARSDPRALPTPAVQPPRGRSVRKTGD